MQEKDIFLIFDLYKKYSNSNSRLPSGYFKEKQIKFNLQKELNQNIIPTIDLELIDWIKLDEKQINLENHKQFEKEFTKIWEKEVISKLGQNFIDDLNLVITSEILDVNNYRRNELIINVLSRLENQMLLKFIDFKNEQKSQSFYTDEHIIQAIYTPLLSLVFEVLKSLLTENSLNKNCFLVQML